MNDDWQHWLARWSDAGIIDDISADRIRAFERDHPYEERTSWPVRLALTFGAVALGAGVLLFVSAHWDGLSPLARFTLVVLMTALFHVGGALAAERFPGLASTLHAVGTIALGASVFLTGQIFNLREHWPGGFLLWTVGAAVGWVLLRDRPQFGLLAVLLPLWLSTEWIDATDQFARSTRPTTMVLASGIFLLAVSYFGAGDERPQPGLRSRYAALLVSLGTVAFVPAAGLLGILSHESWRSQDDSSSRLSLLALGWTIAIGVPAAVAWLTRHGRTWPFAVVVLWTLALWWLRPVGEVTQFAWWALGAVGLVAWGVQEARVERINMGAAVFAATVLAFYFSQVMDKLGRSASLLVVGILFLAGGAALERTRRRLVVQALEGTP